MNRPPNQAEAAFDPEIERTFRARRRRQRQNRDVAIPKTADIEVEGSVNGDGRDETPIRSHGVPTLNNLHSGIVQPEVAAANFELKPVMFRMLQTIGQYNGMPSEDPHLHLKNFMDVADSFKIQGVTTDAIKLKLFPYSLANRAKTWLSTLASNSMRRWEDLAEKFLVKFFPPVKAAQLRSEITSFQQREGESLYESWDRFKELLRKYLNHGIPEWLQMETFYNGLNEQTRGIVDASSGGSLLDKTFTEAYEILERMENNNYQWPSERTIAQQKVSGVLELDAISSLSAHISSLTNTLKNLNLSTDAKAQPQQAHVISNTSNVVTCVFCTGPHIYDDCPQNPQSVFFVGNYNRNNQYSNSYNQGWGNNNNLPYSQGQQQGSNYAPAQQMPRPPFQQQQPQQQYQQTRQQSDNSSSLENMLKDFMARNDATIQSQSASIKNLENQVGQLVDAMRSRPVGTLPSNTENPRREGKEQITAIALRSGKAVEEPEHIKDYHKMKESEGQNEGEQVAVEEEIGEQQVDKQTKSPAQKAAAREQHSQPADKASRPPPSFPQRLHKQQDDKQFKRFMDVLKQLHINVPLVEALEQMPSYAKFMKDILSRKRGVKEYETIAFTQESNRFLNKLPPKLKDPGLFTIPCSIGNTYVG
ncbi:uncharacterized protein LOC133283987 [Gastrolobium bilobum]|uniref:uncharacterized protein LOC133283987 n=1 Tax=Gastrolobium bilobum TaxID=150636 RepID=UPI002AAF9FD6|nr:uncharacterized protein LOC133283987 [Gastrolobium bilobum]